MRRLLSRLFSGKKKQKGPLSPEETSRLCEGVCPDCQSTHGFFNRGIQKETGALRCVCVQCRALFLISMRGIVVKGIRE